MDWLGLGLVGSIPAPLSVSLFLSLAEASALRSWRRRAGFAFVVCSPEIPT